MSLLHKINLYLDTTAMPPTLFGRRALNDPRFVHDLRRGREPRPRTVARVEAFLDAQTCAVEPAGCAAGARA